MTQRHNEKTNTIYFHRPRKTILTRNECYPQNKKKPTKQKLNYTSLLAHEESINVPENNKKENLKTKPKSSKSPNLKKNDIQDEENYGKSNNLNHKVSKEETIPKNKIPKNHKNNFLKEKEPLELNSKEKADFITYWYPIMSNHKAYIIRFVFNYDYNKYAQLDMEPKPDNAFRVFMLWEPVHEKAEISKLTEQKIPTLNRKGLTLVEWGGGKINMLNP